MPMSLQGPRGSHKRVARSPGSPTSSGAPAGGTHQARNLQFMGVWNDLPVELVPLIVFFAFQRHFARGLLAGSVK